MSTLDADPDPPVPSTYRALVQTFTDFLTVSIHTILHERSIYPGTTFLLTRRFNFPVRQSRHPKVCRWISDAVGAVEEEMLKGTVERVVVVIYDEDDGSGVRVGRERGAQTVLERFVWDLGRLPRVSKADIDVPFERTANGEGDRMPVTSVDLAEQLRGCLARLSTCGSKLKPIPEGCAFTVAVECRDEQGAAPVGHPQWWVPVQPSLQKRRGKTLSEQEGPTMGEDLGGVRTRPVRAVDAAEMLFEMWIEEGKGKRELDLPSSSAES